MKAFKSVLKPIAHKQVNLLDLSHIRSFIWIHDRHFDPQAHNLSNTDLKTFTCCTSILVWASLSVLRCFRHCMLHNLNVHLVFSEHVPAILHYSHFLQAGPPFQARHNSNVLNESNLKAAFEASPHIRPYLNHSGSSKWTDAIFLSFHLNCCERAQ